eukprot:Skav214251  [mRNA]  locus=scaffold2045:380292:388636:- [translate_table: standard]
MPRGCPGAGFALGPGALLGTKERQSHREFHRRGAMASWDHAKPGQARRVERIGVSGPCTKPPPYPGHTGEADQLNLAGLIMVSSCSIRALDLVLQVELLHGGRFGSVQISCPSVVPDPAAMADADFTICGKLMSGDEIRVAIARTSTVRQLVELIQQQQHPALARRRVNLAVAGQPLYMNDTLANCLAGEEVEKEVIIIARDDNYMLQEVDIDSGRPVRLECGAGWEGDILVLKRPEACAATTWVIRLVGRRAW